MFFVNKLLIFQKFTLKHENIFKIVFTKYIHFSLKIKYGTGYFDFNHQLLCRVVPSLRISNLWFDMAKTIILKNILNFAFPSVTFYGHLVFLGRNSSDKKTIIFQTYLYIVVCNRNSNF